MGYYELLDPLTPRRGFMDKVLREKIYPNNFDKKSETNVIVSELPGHPVKILQTLETMNPDKTSLLVPSKPWLYQGTLERSNHIYERQMKYIKRIENNGYKVYNKPRDLINVGLN